MKPKAVHYTCSTGSLRADRMDFFFKKINFLTNLKHGEKALHFLMHSNSFGLFSVAELGHYRKKLPSPPKELS